MRGVWQWLGRSANVYQLWPVVTWAIAAVIAAMSGGMVAWLTNLIWWQILLVELISFASVSGLSFVTFKLVVHRMPNGRAVASSPGGRLELDIGRCIFHSSAEVDSEGQWIDNPVVADIETTFRVEQPTQLFKLYLEIDDEEIEPLGEPTYPDSIILPRILERSETHRLRFQLPRRLAAPTNSRIVAIAAGQRWSSPELKLPPQPKRK